MHRRLSRSHFRKAHNYFLACASEIGSPALRLFRKAFVRPPAPRWRNIVLLGADHIGDVLYRTVGLMELKKGLPDCRIHFVASRPAADLIEGHPAIDSVLVASRSVEERSMHEIVALLRDAAPDAVLCYDTGDYWRDQIAVMLAGVPHCAGYTHKGFSGLVTHSVPIVFPQPFAAYFRDFVESISGGRASSLRPQVFLKDEQRKAARDFRRAVADDNGPVVVATLTSRQRSHEAIQRRMAEVLAEVKRRRADATVVLMGAAGDESLLRNLAGEVGLDCQYAAGCLSVVEVVAFFELCDVAFCLDSGPRHMANAAGIPVVFCRNMEFLKEEAGCYLDTEFDIAPDTAPVSYSDEKAPPLFEIDTAVQALLERLN